MDRQIHGPDSFISNTYFLSILDDVGSYFCMRYNKKEQKKLSKIAFKSTTTSGGGAAGAAAAWSGVRNNDMIEMVVHMDSKFVHSGI